MKEEWKTAASISCNLAALTLVSAMLYKTGGATLVSAGLAYGVLGAAISRRIASRKACEIMEFPERAPE
jgi:hypothetical protein